MPKEEKTTFALFSDLLIGTRLYNPEILEGAGIVLSNTKNLNSVIINGGLVARVPKYFGKRNAQYFELLDYDLEKKYGKKVSDKIRKIHDLKKLDLDKFNGLGKLDGKDAEDKKDEINSVGVDSLEDLIEIAQPEIAKI
ncbi:hypothetical protein HYX19_04850, partial [Candidatus Woesearchaeota archaeon]|nr:hypothetical protein [Candidatus Woesearchaeota archaeon]